MRGNWCCPSAWRWPDPLHRPIPQASLWLVLASACIWSGLAAAQPSTVAPTEVKAGVPDLAARVRLLLAESHPHLDAAAMLDYYSRTSPDIHTEIRNHVEDEMAGTAAYLGRLADHYQRLDRVRQRSPTEFDRLMALDLLESRARMLGRLILQLNAAVAEGSAEDASSSRVAMAQAKKELYDVLKRAFDGTQQNQGIELNRLEAELSTMRRLLDERASKRDLIIRQRFIELCGQELPPSPTPAIEQEPGPR